MATDAKPQPQATVGKNFRKQVEHYRQYAETLAAAVANQAPPRWYHPADLGGQPNDGAAVHESLNREEQEDQFISAVSTPETAGTAGDLQLIALQGDWLAAAERAYHARQASAIRCRVHAGTRRLGQGNLHGVINSVLLGYIERTDISNQTTADADNNG